MGETPPQFNHLVGWNNVRLTSTLLVYGTRARNALQRTTPRWYCDRLVAASVIGVIGLTLLMFIVYAEPHHQGIDDAYITYRYAFNLVNGNGFVFNPGDRPIQGTSTPLFTFALATGAVLGADIPNLSLGLNAVALAATLGLFVLIAADLGLLFGGIAAAAIWVTSSLSWATVEGMETPFYTSLIISAIYFGLRRSRRASLIFAALAVVTRLDGVAVLVTVIALLVVERRWSWRDALPGAAILTSWFLLAWYLFGGIVPSSGIAKVTDLPDIYRPFLLSSSTFVNLTLPITTQVSWSPDTLANLVLGGLAIGVLLLLPRRPILVLLLWFILYVAGFTLLRLPNFSWYFAPAALVGSFGLWLAIAQILALAESRLRGNPGKFSSFIVLAVALALCIIGASKALDYRAARSLEALPHQLAGSWLREHAQPGESVVAYETGTIAFLSRLTTVDLLGLTEPDALAHLRQRDYAWAIRQLPNYVFLPENDTWNYLETIFKLPEFARNYVPVARFPFRTGQDYVIYRRAEHTLSPVAHDDWAIEWIAAGAPTSIPRAKLAGYSIVLTNRSDQPWRATGAQAVQISYHWLDDDRRPLAGNSKRSSLPFDIGPGETVMLSAYLVAPIAPGSYLFQWDIVRGKDDSFSRHGTSPTPSTVEIR